MAYKPYPLNWPPRGVFAMWSNDPPDDEFSSVLETVFTDVQAQEIWFDNLYFATRA